MAVSKERKNNKKIVKDNKKEVGHIKKTIQEKND